ncbi:MAG: hypothetical protein JST86_10175 [Bacteroidetes bacterium]|nr:hypothetical protein [Bacteroidota bacterium]
MLEILALIFLTRNIGKLAVQKGLKPGPWKFYTVICWFAFEIVGAFVIGVMIFNQTELLPLMLLAFVCAFGGYVLIRFILQRKPDASIEDEIDRIGVDDLKP